MKSVIIGVVIVLIFIVIMAVNASKYENFIDGLWVADPAFCESAEVSAMMMYIGEKTDGRQRNGYIFVVDEDDKVIVNQGFIVDLGRGWTSPTIGPYKASAEILFDDERLWADDDNEDPDEPVDVTFKFDMASGILRIIRGDQLFARLHKTPM